MADLGDILASMEFIRTWQIQGRASIADLFPAHRRCGIYVLRFANGEVYAGQAADVTRRYVQHRKVHNDIDWISFKSVPRPRLNDEERMAIWALERGGCRLRNVTFTSVPKGESDFDLVMPTDLQVRWVDDPTFSDRDGARVNDTDIRRKHEKRFQRFVGQPFAAETIGILGRYVRGCIPAILRSELSFWSASCLPGTSAPGITVYSRINVNWQEVFTVYREANGLAFSWHLALSSLTDAFGESLEALFRRHPRIEATDHFYEPGGQDQINLVTRSLDAAEALLEESNALQAMRVFNLRLMRKGPCNFARHHCFDLADRLVNL